MSVSIYYTKVYKNETASGSGKNKPKTNPIAEKVKLMQSVYLERIIKKNAAKVYEKTKPKQTQFTKSANERKLLCNKGLQKKDDFAVRKNKPNSNPISKMAKMNANLYVIEDYENETTHRPKKTNPNKACPERIEFTLSVIEGNGPISPTPKGVKQKSDAGSQRSDICL